MSGGRATERDGFLRAPTPAPPPPPPPPSALSALTHAARSLQEHGLVQQRDDEKRTRG